MTGSAARRMVESAWAGLLVGALTGCGHEQNRPPVAPTGERSAIVEVPATPEQSSDDPVMAVERDPAGERECCKGLNECRGLGGCAVESANDCAGKNECKGRGGCNFNCDKRTSDCCAGKNECKGQGGCETDQHDCAGQNDCRGLGGCNAHCPK